MGFLSKIFGSKATFEQLQKLVSQQRFADARVMAEELLSQGLDADVNQQVLVLAAQSGDALAQRNLDEGLGFLRNGQGQQALDYFELAQDLVHRNELRLQIVAAKQEATEQATSKSASITVAPQNSSDEDLLSGQDDVQLDLILTSYPEDLRHRYQEKNGLFKHAFLLTHAGEDQNALAAWQKIPETEQDDLYFFELGSLYGRCGELAAARNALEQSLHITEDQPLAVEALVAVLQQSGEFSDAENLLRKLLEQGMNPRFCHAQLTYLFAQQGDFDKAAQEARLGLTVQNGDPAFLQLAALVFERLSCFEEAEQALKKIPAGGCCGGISLPLAEFWLRQKKELHKVLDVFNDACRQDPDNPRWQLRAAQTYSARNWRKDALSLLHKVVGDPRLEPELAEEAAQELALLQE